MPCCDVGVGIGWWSDLWWVARLAMFVYLHDGVDEGERVTCDVLCSIRSRWSCPTQTQFLVPGVRGDKKKKNT